MSGAQDKKSAPLKLALLVGCGIMLPLGVAAWFLFRTQKYHGPNNVAQETLDIFCRCAWSMQWSMVMGDLLLTERPASRNAACSGKDWVYAVHHVSFPDLCIWSSGGRH